MAEEDRGPNRRAVYPGTFDPVTLGHLDLIRRATKLFQTIDVIVAHNADKDTWFTTEERVEMLQSEVTEFPSVRVHAFRGLIVDYMRERGIQFMLRGVRTVSDFEYEYQMAMTNRSLLFSVDTVFMMPSLCFSFTSSRLIKEIISSGGDVTEFVTPGITTRLVRRLARKREQEGQDPQ